MARAPVSGPPYDGGFCDGLPSATGENDGSSARTRDYDLLPVKKARVGAKAQALDDQPGGLVTEATGTALGLPKLPRLVY